MTTHDANMRRRNAFFTDFENSCLEDFKGVIPVGPRRYLDPEWARFIRSQVYHHSYITWEQYCAFVESGGGDAWFQVSEADAPSVQATQEAAAAAAEQAAASDAECIENPDG